MHSAFEGCSNMDVLATDAPDLSAVTDFREMFWNCSSLVGTTAFNSWNVGSGTFFNNMFRGASSFNQDIGNWNVSLGTSFNRMFAFASSFNQDIGAWDVSNGTGFNNIFNGATSFDQDLGAWNVGNMVTGNAMFNNSGMSQNNWDTTLIGWEAQAFSNFNINIGAVGLSFCYATVERDNMINAGIFSFTGDALSCPPPTLHGKGSGGIITNDGASSLELWIDPDLGVTTNSGILVNSILDQSGNGFSFSSSGTTLTTWKDNSVYDVTLTGTSSPSYEAGPTELANFNPVVNFDGDDHFHVGTAIDFQTSIMFGVGKASATGTVFLYHTVEDKPYLQPIVIRLY